MDVDLCVWQGCHEIGEYECFMRETGMEDAIDWDWIEAHPFYLEEDGYTEKELERMMEELNAVSPVSSSDAGEFDDC